MSEDGLWKGKYEKVASDLEKLSEEYEEFKGNKILTLEMSA